MPSFYVFAKSEMIISCRDIVLSLNRSSTERFRDKQLMSLYRLCCDIVLSLYSSVTSNVVSNYVYNMTFKLKVEWKTVILSQGQNNRGQKCTKSVFLTTIFGRKYLGQKCTKTASMTKFSGQKWPRFLPANIVSKCCVKL